MNNVHGSTDPAVLARAAAKVKRHILPLFVVMFIVNYIDRVNIGFVRSHLETDLGIGAAAYGTGERSPTTWNMKPNSARLPSPRRSCQRARLRRSSQVVQLRQYCLCR